MKLQKSIIAISLGVFIFTACEKDDPEVINEAELISNVTLTLTSENDEEVVFGWHDENGDGIVDDEEVTLGSLSPNTTYNAIISLNDEDDDHDDHEEEVHEEDEGDDHDHEHGDDIDEEIQEEADDHQFFYSAVTGLTVAYTDTDVDGNPVGVETTFTTDSNYVGGDLTITLRHKPNKLAEGVAAGDITNAGGETDVEITFALGLDK